MIKRVFKLLSWLGMAVLFATGGMTGYLFASGRLNAERINQIAAVLRGEYPKMQVVASQPAKEVAPPQTSRDELAQLEARKRFYEMVSERHQREVEDRSALNQTIQLDVNRQLEQVEAKEKKLEQEKVKSEQATEQSGFQQTMEIISDMEPKLAKDVLMARKDADAVQMLLQMDPGKRKKVLNGCKTPEEKAWVSRVLLQMRNLDTAQLTPAAGEQVKVAGPAAAPAKSAAVQ